MKKIRLKHGTLNYHSSFILANPKDASQSTHACVIECRNHVSYGKANFGIKIPHFIYFSGDISYKGYTKSICEEINNACINVWPNFRKVIADQYQFGRENKFTWEEAPTIGYFPILDRNDPVFNTYYIKELPVYIERD